MSPPKREEAQGDQNNNLLLIQERKEGYSRPEAIEKLRQMTHERFARFLRLEPQIPDMDSMLDPTERVALRRYLYCETTYEHLQNKIST